MNEGWTYTEQVQAPTTVLELLGRRRHSTEAQWRERLEQGQVLVNGQPCAQDRALRPGDWLSWRRPPWQEPEVPLDWRVLWQEGDLLAVHKPSGLPCAPAGGFLQRCLQAQVTALWPGFAPMHRLGRGTSGLVLYARGREQARVAAAFREGRLEKRYRALAEGAPSCPSTIDLPIGPVEHPRLGRMHAANPEGRPARTHLSLREQRADCALLDVQIETGRPHQIRIHLSAIGHPLCGDPLYGPGGQPRPDALPGDLGYHLHAWRIDWEDLRLEDPPPPPLRSAGEEPPEA